MFLRSPEFNRKLVHLASLAIPIGYYFTNKKTAIIILGLLLVFFTIWDILRIKSCGKLIILSNKVFMRKNEQKALSGAFYFTLAAFLGVILFSKYVFILSISILIICDTMAALIGLNFAKYKVYDKSLEGWLAFFISGIIVIILINLFFNMPLLPISSIIALFSTSLLELFSTKLKINDNLLILLAFGISYSFLM